MHRLLRRRRTTTTNTPYLARANERSDSGIVYNASIHTLYHNLESIKVTPVKNDWLVSHHSLTMTQKSRLQHIT
jgi:phosphohistidine phosphatase SixA